MVNAALPMILSPATVTLLASLDELSKHTLARKSDLGTLIEVAGAANKSDSLRKLSFVAKFLVRTYGIMKRIGPQGNGYDTLRREFSTNLATSRPLLEELLASAPEDIRTRMTNEYLSLTPSSIDSLLLLFRDLSWYKNWLLDTRRMSP
jgi:hypothetical protein